MPPPQQQHRCPAPRRAHLPEARREQLRLVLAFLEATRQRVDLSTWRQLLDEALADAVERTWRVVHGDP